MANTRVPQASKQAKRGSIYTQTKDGGIQLGSGPDRWLLYEDYVHLAPYHTGGGRMLKFDAELKPFVDTPSRSALVIIDMQNDFCEPGGWTDRSGLDYEGCRESIPGIQRAIEAAREQGMSVIWVYWHNRPDLRNLGAPTLYSFKHKLDQDGIGQSNSDASSEASSRGRRNPPAGNGPVLTQGSWGAEIVSDLKDHMREEDLHVWKFRMSGFWGTHLDQILRTQGIQTLFFAGVNVDQCVTSTMQDAYFRDYNCVLVEDASSTSSPDYAKQGVVFNAKNCWGFVTDSRKMADAREFTGE